MDYFPFFALGFRGNPFRRLTDDESVAVTVLPDGLLRVAGSSPDHLQILADQGRGKSTCLRALETIFTRNGLRTAHEYLADGRNSFNSVPDGTDVFLLDEAQRLKAREWARLLVGASDHRRGFRLVVGVHDDMASLFARHRLRLKTVRLDSINPEYMQAILTRRLAFFLRSMIHQPSLSLWMPHAICATSSAATYASSSASCMRCSRASLRATP